MRYKIRTKVRSVEQITRVVRAWKVGDNVLQDTEDLGWFVCFEGSWERLHLGRERPALHEGQTVEITIEGL
jgi:hypothetical protein